MAEVKAETKTEVKKEEVKTESSGSSFDPIIILKFFGYVACVFIIGLVAYNLILSNSTNFISFMHLLYSIEILLIIFIMFLFFRWRVTVADFRKWSDMMGAFFDKGRKPLEVKVEYDDSTQKRLSNIKEVFSNNGKELWGTAYKDLVNILQRELDKITNGSTFEEDAKQVISFGFKYEKELMLSVNMKEKTLESLKNEEIEKNTMLEIFHLYEFLIHEILKFKK